MTDAGARLWLVGEACFVGFDVAALALYRSRLASVR